MPYFSAETCATTLDTLQARLLEAIDGAKYTQDAAGLVLQEHDISTIERSITLWEDRYQSALANASGANGSALKLIRRRPV